MLWKEALWYVIPVLIFRTFDLRHALAEIETVAAPLSADHTILICTKCRGADEANRLRKALAPDLPAGYALRGVNCMAGCDYPCAVGFQADGKATYLFGDITSVEDIAAIGEFAWQFLESRDGWTSAGERPAALYNKTLARLPALKEAATS